MFQFLQDAPQIINRKFRQEPSTLCPLCLKQVSLAKWEDSSHRQRCAVAQAGALESMAAHDAQLTCDNCDKAMKAWPQQGPPVRKCNFDEVILAFHNNSLIFRVANANIQVFLVFCSMCYVCVVTKAQTTFLVFCSFLVKTALAPAPSQ